MCVLLQNEMEATESAAIGAAASSSRHRGEGSSGAQCGSSSRQYRRLLFTIQRTSTDQPSATAAAAAGTIHRFHGSVSLDGGRALPQCHLRPRLPTLTRVISKTSRQWVLDQREWFGLKSPRSKTTRSKQLRIDCVVSVKLTWSVLTIFLIISEFALNY